MEELSLQFDVIRIQWDNASLLNCRPVNGQADELKAGGRLDRFGFVTVKASADGCDVDGLVRGLEYRFYGFWSNHEKYGWQFTARTAAVIEPHGRTGVVAYLQQADKIGPTIAGRLFDKLGSQAVKIIRDDPEVAVTAAGEKRFSIKVATEASELFRRIKATEGVNIDLIDLFDGRGFPRTLPKKCLKEFGNKAPALIRKNPYLLMRFPRCGFTLCDRLYLDQGGTPDALKRQALAAWHAIATDRDGHTWHKPEAAVAGIQERVGGVGLRPLDALQLAKRARILAVHRDADGFPWLAHGPKAENERRIADRTKAFLNSPANWPGVSGIAGITEHQAGRLWSALQSPLGIFTGGPGTGKTYTSARLIRKILDRQGGGVAVAAPTGKAAVRITEAMAANGVNLRATTIHSLLGVEDHSEGDGWSFKHNAGNPLLFGTIVVDEASMLDVDLAAALFDAVGSGSHLLLVGDPGQLPPVGHGAPLRDLIAAGVPTGELTEIQRNAGLIVRACHEIRQGAAFQVAEPLNPPVDNLGLLPGVSGKATLNRIVQTINRLANRGLADPIADVQVIVAVNAKSDLSRRKVNEVLQRELNAGGQRVDSNPFRIGDKIVNLKNGFFPTVEDAPPTNNQETNEDGKVFVANGEQGRVKAVDRQLTIAELDSPARLIRIPRGTGSKTDGQAEATDDEKAATGCSWDLAYAITVHKSQGSEWPVVIVPGDEYAGARRIQSREWVYTAISRAKTACFLAGKKSTFDVMVHRQAIAKRKTFLLELITNGK